jgi:hypothetical protein
VGRGYCVKHYKRFQNHGSATHPVNERNRVPKGTRCKVDDCNEAYHAKGYCIKHYSRVVRWGDPLRSDRHFWCDQVAHFLWNSAKGRGKRDGIEFSLQPEDIVVPAVCPVLGLKLQRGTTKFRDNSPSLDRIDNSKGYLKGNVIVVSQLANRIKSNATVEQLCKVAEFYKGLTT